MWCPGYQLIHVTQSYYRNMFGLYKKKRYSFDMETQGTIIVEIYSG